MSPSIALTLTPESNQIHGYGYDAALQVLAVEYGSNHETVTYHYKAVTPEEAAGLDAAPSKGSYVYKFIKPKHDFDRIEKEARDPTVAPEPQEEQARA